MFKWGVWTCLFLFLAQNTYAWNTFNCSNYIPDINFTQHVINSCRNNTGGFNYDDCRSACDNAIGVFICTHNIENYQEVLTNTSRSCQIIFNSIEEITRANNTQSACDLRIRNLEDYMSASYYFCSVQLTSNCTYPDAKLLVVKYKNLIRDSMNCLQNLTDQKCANSWWAYKYANLSSSQQNIITPLMEAYSPNDHNFTLTKAEDCISICETEEPPNPFVLHSCYMGKAHELDTLTWMNPNISSNERVNILEQTADAWEKAGNYSNAGKTYENLAGAEIYSTHSLSDKFLFLMGTWDYNITSYYFQAGVDYEKANLTNDRNRVFVYAMNFQNSFQSKSFQFRSALNIILFLLICLCGGLVIVQDINERRIFKSEYRFWNKKSIETFMQILATLAIGLAFFVPEHLKISERMSQIFQSELTLYIQLNPFFREINIYASMFALFSLLMFLLFILFDAWVTKTIARSLAAGCRWFLKGKPGMLIGDETLLDLCNNVVVTSVFLVLAIVFFLQVILLASYL